MIEFSAQTLVWCIRELRCISNDCLMGSSLIPGDQPVFALSRDLDDRARNRAIESFLHIEEAFRNIGMNLTADTAKEITESLRDPHRRRNFQWLSDQVKNIEKLARKEMEGKAFFYVPQEHAKYFPRRNNPHIFGDVVAAAFPSAIYDISESGICLALARGSGCVFHLMRVLEVGLRALGNKFGISLAHTDWGPALNEIEKKIRAMHEDPTWKALPDWKEQRESYSKIASHFGVLKDAWRNYTMYARGQYTEEEAGQIFENVKSFMQKIAT